jgi:hypothetical protein
VALSPWVKRSGREPDRLPPSSAEGRMMELYLHFPYVFVSLCLNKRKGNLTSTAQDRLRCENPIVSCESKEAPHLLWNTEGLLP